ncbi:hypothetical protein [Sphingomonas sp.]|uniref:hypothetical protein n=1 Tax=Sphingomonas sp. TaxID=28214 RepID=UPI0031D72B35
MEEQNGADLARRIRIAQLLDRHPKLDPAESAEVVDFLKTGSMIDIGMLRGDPAYRAKIEAIKAANHSEFRVGPLRSILIGLAIALPFLLLCWLIADWGA